MNLIVIDTSVLIDIFLESRPRHTQARILALFLIKNRIRIKVPAHALFELSCAIKNEISITNVKFFKGITESNPLEIEPVPIDESFFKKYFHSSLPYIKAGDLLFIALAKGENALLITEDNKQYKKAQELGISTYRIEEFLNSFVNQVQD